MERDFVPVKSTPVRTRLTPGPLRWKLWLDERSVILNRWVPALSRLTFLPPDLSVIVKPGPTLPLSVLAVAVPVPITADAAKTVVSAATASDLRPVLSLIVSSWIEVGSG